MQVESKIIGARWEAEGGWGGGGLIRPETFREHYQRGKIKGKTGENEKKR